MIPDAGNSRFHGDYHRPPEKGVEKWEKWSKMCKYIPSAFQKNGKQSIKIDGIDPEILEQVTREADKITETRSEEIQAVADQLLVLLQNGGDEESYEDAKKRLEENFELPEGMAYSQFLIDEAKKSPRGSRLTDQVEPLEGLDLALAEFQFAHVLCDTVLRSVHLLRDMTQSSLKKIDGEIRSLNKKIERLSSKSNQTHVDKIELEAYKERVEELEKLKRELKTNLLQDLRRVVEQSVAIALGGITIGIKIADVAKEAIPVLEQALFIAPTILSISVATTSVFSVYMLTQGLVKEFSKMQTMKNELVKLDKDLSNATGVKKELIELRINAVKKSMKECNFTIVRNVVGIIGGAGTAAVATVSFIGTLVISLVIQSAIAAVVFSTIATGGFVGFGAIGCVGCFMAYCLASRKGKGLGALVWKIKQDYVFSERLIRLEEMAAEMDRIVRSIDLDKLGQEEQILKIMEKRDLLMASQKDLVSLKESTLEQKKSIQVVFREIIELKAADLAALDRREEKISRILAANYEAIKTIDSVLEKKYQTADTLSRIENKLEKLKMNMDEFYQNIIDAKQKFLSKESIESFIKINFSGLKKEGVKSVLRLLKSKDVYQLGSILLKVPQNYRQSKLDRKKINKDYLDVLKQLVKI